MKAVAIERIRRQPFFGKSAEKDAAIERVKGVAANIMRLTSGRHKSLAARTVAHIIKHADENGALPTHIKMRKHHWKTLRKAFKDTGVATHKQSEGRRFAGVPVIITT